MIGVHPDCRGLCLHACKTNIGPERHLHHTARKMQGNEVRGCVELSVVAWSGCGALGDQGTHVQPRAFDTRCLAVRLGNRQRRKVHYLLCLPERCHARHSTLRVSRVYCAWYILPESRPSAPPFYHPSGDPSVAI